MILKPGVQLGPYTVRSVLGAGGMGEVYRAHDSKLGRDVALKVLPSTFAADSGRVARFTREAHLLASLNHPNIAAIYGVEDSSDVYALVLELVEGQTLAERIAEGPIPVDEALSIARQIAEALEAAHDQGVVHRDLKPANIALRPDGTVKVLDFGLAKAMDGADGVSPVSQALTLTSPTMVTGAGVILGTAPYMSPEQARGHQIDHRADVWAFGVVVFEMLTGRRLFPGDTVSDTLASVLKTEPSWDTLPHSTPPMLRRLLRSCLEKDPKRRLRAIGDRRLLLDEPVHATQATSSRVATIAVAAAGLLASALLALGVVHFREAAAVVTRAPIARVVIQLPLGDQLDHKANPALALSPDGTKLAYVGVRGNAARQLFLRVMDGTDAKAIAGTEGAHVPFFSPDGQWVGFFAQGKLKKVPADGGIAQVLCDAPSGMGADWATEDTIYFMPFNTSGVWKVAASGGTPQEVTKLDRSKGEVSHRWPQLLPGGSALLFTVWNGPGWDEKSLQMQDLQTGERRVLAEGASTGRYVTSGHLVYNRDGVQTLMALPFDVERLEVTGGPAVALAERVWEGGAEGAQYATSNTGTMAYVASHPARYERRMVWVDRTGKVEPLTAMPRPYYDPRISPDGRQFAVSSEEASERVWTFDFARPILTALTGAGSSQAPVWTPDGMRVIYRGTRMGFRNVFWRAADGSGEEARLTTSDNLHTPVSVSPDGKHLAYAEVDPATGTDIWLLALDGNGAAEPFLRTTAGEGNAHFSPDGRWLAYVSDESGRAEVYVQPFPSPGSKWMISTDGGNEPVWSRDGRELFYRNGDRMMTVAIATERGFVAGLPRQLFEGAFEPTGTGTSGFDVSLDGRRFLMVQPTAPERPATQVDVVINWFEELKQRMPTTVAPRGEP
ncbi:MAG TPA: protein kinase [Vicinamibacterales bacterium]